MDALESEATWSEYINANETTIDGLKALKVTRNSAVVVYFEKKVLKTVSAATEITADSDAKTKAAATKTAAGTMATAKTASSAADANKAAAWKTLSDHVLSGKA